MALRIEAHFNMSRINKLVKEKVQNLNRAVLDNFKRIGEAFISEARLNGNYTDQTGNLRASIGYVILKDGKQIFSSFPGDKVEGRRQGRKVAKEVAADFTSGYVLIVVAGMEYAAAVEARGRDVITSGSKNAEIMLRAAMARLKSKLA